MATSATRYTRNIFFLGWPSKSGGHCYLYGIKDLWISSTKPLSDHDHWRPLFLFACRYLTGDLGPTMEQDLYVRNTLEAAIRFVGGTWYVNIVSH